MKDFQQEFDAIEVELQGVLSTLTSPLEKTIHHVLRESISTGRLGNYPVAAALIDERKGIVTLGVNRSFAPTKSSSAHAEMEALDAFEKKGRLSDTHTLLVTLEPCLMCTSRILLSGVKRVEFLYRDSAGGGTTFCKTFPEDFKHLAKNVSFNELNVEKKLVTIGERLYEIGERVWKAQLGL